MSWRLAKSLDQLREQVNLRWPHRSKVSDGTIGDARHAANKSDHNPDQDGVVKALDITHDPASGPVIQNLHDGLVASRDSRIKYLICNGKITSGSQGPQAWVSRKYTGSNKHNRHIHISVRPEKQFYDDTKPWVLNGLHAPAEPSVRVLRKGDRGEDVAALQRVLINKGFSIGVADGIFGERTEKAIKTVQKAQGLVVDGLVGEKTRKALGLSA